MIRSMLRRTSQSFDYFLDTYTGAHSAFSFRKLSSTYSGNCILARRESDLVEQDFGFVNNVLNTSALLSFAGSSNVTIKTWYDQSGNGNDYQGTEIGAQFPIIVDSGVLITENGKPSVLFPTDSTPHFTGVNNILNNKPALSVVAVSKKTGSTGGAVLYISTDTNAGITRARLVYDQTANKIEIGGRRLNANSYQSLTSASNYTGNLESILGVLDYANSDAYLYLNGTLENSTTSFQTDGNTPTGNVLNNRVGRQAATANIFTGYLSEIIIYETTQNANAVGIDANIKAYYGT